MGSEFQKNSIRNHQKSSEHISLHFNRLGLHIHHRPCQTPNSPGQDGKGGVNKLIKKFQVAWGSRCCRIPFAAKYEIYLDLHQFTAVLWAKWRIGTWHVITLSAEQSACETATLGRIFIMVNCKVLATKKKQLDMDKAASLAL